MSLTLLCSLSAAALVTGTVSALTLDTDVIREIPYLERLLITVDGDTTSSSRVELSGEANHLIKLPTILGTTDVLQAPLGNFIHTTRLSGDSFALGTLTTDLFNFDIISYYISAMGGGGINDGSCPADQAAV